MRNAVDCVETLIAAAVKRELEPALSRIEEQLRRLSGVTVELLDVDAAATLTGFSARTVRARAKRGTLPGFKPQGSSEWRFKRSELLAAMGLSLGAVDLEATARKIAGRK